MVFDPVCRMQIEEKNAVATAEYNGQKIYFCSEGCKEEFEKNPQRYAGRAA